MIQNSSMNQTSSDSTAFAELLPIQRTATLKDQGHRDDCRTLELWRDLPAYVLLGEPGSGKTTVFKQEANAMGSAAIYLSTKDFITLDHELTFSGKTLFIDALDERRSDSGSTEGPLEAVRSKLQRLGKPKFRLSCREADWYFGGAKDLAAVSPDGKVCELRLDYLAEADIKQLLEFWLSGDANDSASFIDTADRHNLRALLQSPLLLKLLVGAVSRNSWPSSRYDVFELACSEMVQEQNPVRRLANVSRQYNKEDLLDAAGLLFSVLLLSDSQRFTLDPLDHTPGCVRLVDLPESLGISEDILRRVLNTKLFAAEGEQRCAWHRTIAEYLGARSLAKKVTCSGLPINRVLALMSADDSCIVDPLRGLYGWLTVHCESERSMLIEVDPLGLVLYSDVRAFSVADKRRVLKSLRYEAEKFPWFRNDNWESRPFGALGTAELVKDFKQLLTSPERDIKHNAHLACVIDAILYGDALPELAPELFSIVLDATHTSRTRKESAATWLKCKGFERTSALALLADIRAGKIVDDDDEICGKLLTELYPKSISAQEAIRNLHVEKAPNLIGRYHMFWAVEFVNRTTTEEITSALDSLSEIISMPEVQTDSDEAYPKTETIRTIAMQLLVKGLSTIGEVSTDEQIYRWLWIGRTEYSFSQRNQKEHSLISEWLTKHPHRMKSIYEYAINDYVARNTISRRPWEVENVLYSAQRPSDWFNWLLDKSQYWTDEELVKHCVMRATSFAINRANDFTITLTDLENWVVSNQSRWPNAGQWILEMSFMPLDSREGTNHRRNLKIAKANILRREKRRSQILPLLPDVFNGTASPRLMADLATAYRHPFADVRGETGLERVADWLGGSVEEAIQVINGLTLVLKTSELHSLSEVEALHKTGKHFCISSVALLAAELLFDRDPTVLDLWSENVIDSLVAYHLVDELAPNKSWFTALCNQRPEDVCRVYLPLAEASLSGADVQHTNVLNVLRNTDVSERFLALVLPRLVHAITSSPTNDQLRIFNLCIVQVGMQHLSREQWRRILEERLADKSLSVELFIALHVACISFDPTYHLSMLRTLSVDNPEVALPIRSALNDQQCMSPEYIAEAPEVVSWVVELLAECAISSKDPNSHETDEPFGEGSRLIHSLTRQLASTSSHQAGEELLRLSELICMSPWSLHIDWCIGNQRKLARTSSFAAPNASEVANILLNRQPANAKDMALLLIDRMIWLAKRIRYEETNLLHLFWEPDGLNDVKPKGENACRDILQSLLRERLLLSGVQIEKEAMAAGDRRADLQVSTLNRGERIVVPVEIKKENHLGVWTAWWDQLEARYTANPGAKGIGTYIVLWFGHNPKSNPSKIKPLDAEHMAKLLGESMPNDRRNRIFGLVIDLSLRD